MNKIREIIFPISQETTAFEKNLRNIIENYDNFLKEDLEKFMFSNPKRLRPIFVFLFSKILKIENFDMVQNIALACELIHSASLVHDDIIDEEKTRRSRPTFFDKFGAKAAVLEGDLLLSSALFVLSETNINILKIFSKRIALTINGELEQNSSLFQKVDIEKYLQKTLNKTGNIFLAGLEALYELGEFQEDLKDDLINFTKNYSLAFQIKNDIENIKKDKTDIKNGNYTLVVLYYLKDYGAENLKEADFEKYIKLAQDKMLQYKLKALEYLEKVENSTFRTALLNLAKATLQEL